MTINQTINDELEIRAIEQSNSMLRYRRRACKIQKDSLSRLQYFKDPGISKAAYKAALKNINETISEVIKIENKEDSIQALIKLSIDSISIHCKKHGASQTTKDLRVLGNAIRIASQSNSDIRYAVSEIILGLDAGALKLEASGEISCLKEVCRYIASRKRIPIIFDIGANKGEWSKQVVNNLETFSIHLFEPNKSIKNQLTTTIQSAIQKKGIQSSAHINMHGIGNTDKADLFISDLSDEMASTVLDRGKPLYKSYKKREVEMVKGDTYCELKGISEIEFVKIDTEGSELNILKSFENMLSNGKIRFIQFEYGMTTFYSDSSLGKFFELMESNYSIHRIFPEGITEPLEYSEDIETFRWSNFLAVRKDSADFMNLFSRQTSNSPIE